MIRLTALFVLLAKLALGDAQARLVPMLDGRIVGGTDADIRDHPWQISLQVDNSHFCGAVIISTNWVLTAAHCVDEERNYSIRVGSSIRSSGGTVYGIWTIIIHPNYNRPTVDYDIAALLIEIPIQYSESVQAISVAPEGSGPVAGATATLTGWGALAEGGSAPLTLQVVEVPIVSQADCRQAYSVTSITDRMFCAGLLGVGGKDACQGDSGSPVVVGGQVAGLVSWGNGCARPDFPGVKTNLMSLRSWIRETTGV